MYQAESMFGRAKSILLPVQKESLADTDPTYLGNAVGRSESHAQVVELFDWSSCMGFERHPARHYWQRAGAEQVKACGHRRR